VALRPIRRRRPGETDEAYSARLALAGDPGFLLSRMPSDEERNAVQSWAEKKTAKPDGKDHLKLLIASFVCFFEQRLGHQEAVRRAQKLFVVSTSVVNKAVSHIKKDHPERWALMEAASDKPDPDDYSANDHCNDIIREHQRLRRVTRGKK